MAINRKSKLVAVNPIIQAANPAPTLTPQALTALLAEVAALKAQLASAAEAKASTINDKSSTSAQNELAVIKAFKARGFGVVTPRVDVLTFNRWVAKGFRPIVGSKSIKVKNLRLFHKSQVRQLTAEERGAMAAQSADAVARNEKPKGNGKAASVHQLNPQQGPLL
jgi:hypothetical protein